MKILVRTWVWLLWAVVCTTFAAASDNYILGVGFLMIVFGLLLIVRYEWKDQKASPDHHLVVIVDWAKEDEADISNMLQELVDTAARTKKVTYLLFKGRVFEAQPGEDWLTVAARHNQLYSKRIEPVV